MTLLYHNNFITTVHRLSDGEILAHSHLLCTDREAAASIRATTAAFSVLAARWDILRSPGGRLNGGRDVDELNGAQAYLGAGAALRAATKGDGELPRQLLAECVKGIIQAETYLYRDRGFADAEAYEAHWKKNYTGACHRYSNREYKGRRWSEHVADRTWSDHLFIRCKTAAVSAVAGGLDLRGSFSDSFHELDVSITVENGAIVTAGGSFLRAPDPICLETPALLTALVGQRLAELGRELLSRRVAGTHGCAHLADLVDFLLQAAHNAHTGPSHP